MAEEGQVLSASLVMDPATQALIKENLTALQVAQSWTIDDPDTADAVAVEANRAKTMVKTLDAKYKEFIVPAQQIIDAARNLFKPAINDLEAAVDHYNGLLVDWQDREKKRVAAENAAREEEARKLRAEAEAKAAAERAKADEIARQKREQAERDADARKKAEDDARAAAAERQKAIEEGNAKAAQEANERMRLANIEAQQRAKAEAKGLEQAENAEAEGAAKAQQFTLEAESAATSVPREEVRAVAGITFRGKYVAVMSAPSEDEAKKLICMHAVATHGGRPELLALLKLDTVAIGRMATALKTSFNVPGFKAEIQTGAAKAKSS